ncbi:Protein of uncharacterised function (DUF2510) [Mycobacteroides abscessus subsp. massiliense]|nr:Protein of uncharacterised function (DUF2510) [Mycobacteroides abscessus subsp. massiliense]SKV04494.1 Protein of uncharacterised function (DUF2510) [Mycobacteroides abscessus subsp. massiliense]SLG32320.1 Protein of uncharacterised function (DUF2510) [Mycobacteroides abscessus subsp. abscessus]
MILRMSAPVPAPGWFPDPSGAPQQRYFDGVRWTDNVAPYAPPRTAHAQPSAVASTAVAVSVGGGINHTLHLVLTVLTCGLWAPVWLLVAIFGGRGGGNATVVR